MALVVKRQLGEYRVPLVITHNSEAKVAIMDITSNQETQKASALLKILALGDRKIEKGKVVLARDTIRRLSNRKARDARDRKR